MQPAVVVPVDPFEGGDLDLVGRLPGSAGFDQFGLVEADGGLGQGVVVGVADAADRRVDTSGGEAFGERDRGVLPWLPASL